MSISEEIKYSVQSTSSRSNTQIYFPNENASTINSTSTTLKSKRQQLNIKCEYDSHKMNNNTNKKDVIHCNSLQNPNKATTTVDMHLTRINSYSSTTSPPVGNTQTISTLNQTEEKQNTARKDSAEHLTQLSIAKHLKHKIIDEECETKTDIEISLHCMTYGQLSFNVCYENLNLLSMKIYSYGIPCGLEGLKRRLIFENGLNFEGIFRLRGKDVKVNTAKNILNNQQSICELNVTPIEIGQLIKCWFRELPCDYPGFLSIELMNANINDKFAIAEEFEKLSDPRRTLLLWMFFLWIEIEEHGSANKMTLKSLSIVFSPNLVRTKTEDENNSMIFLEMQQCVQRIILILCQMIRAKELEIYSKKVNGISDAFQNKREIADIVSIDNNYGRNVQPMMRKKQSIENIPVKNVRNSIATFSDNVSQKFKHCVIL